MHGVALPQLPEVCLRHRVGPFKWLWAQELVVEDLGQYRWAPGVPCMGGRSGLPARNGITHKLRALQQALMALQQAQRNGATL